MKQLQRSWWVIGGLLVGACVNACGSEPSCEDLANCVAPPGGTSSSSGSTSGSSSSSGSMTTPEVCTNGLDDDKDGSIDCSDSECMDMYTCIPPIPAGFTEIVMISVKPYDETPTPCAGGAMPTLFYQNPANGACDSCTCDASGVQCIPGQLATSFSFFGGNCSNANPIGALPADQCQAVNGDSAILQAAPMMTGSCTTSSTSGGPMTPPMETTIATCSVDSVDGRGCATSGTCVPSEGLSTAEHLCIKKPGHEVCPGEWPLALYAYESFTDERTECTNCSCTASCTGGEYTIYPDGQGACNAGGMAVNTLGVCVQSGSMNFSMSVKMSPLVASCTTTGGQTGGTVTPMNETTFCCY